MVLANLLRTIDEEIGRLMQARALLAGIDTDAHSGKRRVAAITAKKAKRKRTLSAEARQRIAEARRQRWAAMKKPKA